MTCTEVLELIPAAIDGEVEEDILSSFNRHLDECSPCREEFELEQMTKRLVRKQLAPTEAPPGLLQRVKRQLTAERLESETAPAPPRRPFRAMLALGSVAAVVLLLIFITPGNSHHSHAQPADGNIIHQTYNNFDRVLDGKVRPEILSDDPAAVMAYFQPMVDFKVHIPRMKNFKLLGAVCTQYRNQCVAQLIYQGSRDIIYLYQISSRTALRKDGELQLPPDAMTDLQRTGWYFENKIPDCSLAIQIIDSTLCCALADIRKDALLASLTETY